jgi:hypothetical protein
MDIYVNDKKIDFSPEFPVSWKDFFQKLLTENHIEGSHSIVELTVDDTDSLQVITSGLSPEMVPGDSREIRIKTEDSAAVAGKALTTIFPLIENMETEILSAALLYKEENIKEASGKIASIMEAFRSMVQFINSVGVGFSIDFDTVRYDDTISLAGKMESFLKTFSDIVTVQREKDYKKMAGYLQNQLLKDMAAWNRIVTIIREKIEGNGND